MSAESKPAGDADHLRMLAQARGLGRAYALFPEIIVAAHERAVRSAALLPADVPVTTEPATAFDPRRGGATR